MEISGYQLNVLIVACLYVLLAVGLQLTTGLAGQISLGHAAFYAIGGYTAALLATRAGWPFLATLPASILVVAVAGLILGAPSLRVRDDFLAIVTLGLGLITQSLANNLPLTGGALGISAIPAPAIGSFTFRLESYTGLVVAITALGVGVAVLLSRSRLGLIWRAVRDDDLAAGAMGMPVRVLKVTAFAVGSAYAGLAGALLAYHLGFIGAESFGVSVSITVLAMIVLGGLGSLPGAVVGALVLSLLPEVLRPLASYRLTLYGALLAFVIAYRPGGLLGGGTVPRLPWARLARRPRAGSAP